MKIIDHDAEVNEEDFNEIVYISPPLLCPAPSLEELKELLIGGPDRLG